MQEAKFHCLIVSPDPKAVQAYVAEVSKTEAVGSTYCLTSYPNEEVLGRVLRRHAFDLLLIDCSDLAQSMPVVLGAQAQNPHLETVAICCEDVSTLAALMRAGVREYVTFDAPLEVFRENLTRAVAKMNGKPIRDHVRGDVISFLPSKPGGGASTIAAHTALSVSRLNQHRALLVDMDFDAPMQAFLNMLRPEHFLQEALTRTAELDDDIWLQIISQRGKLDILPADADGASLFNHGQIQQLLKYVRGNYDLAFFDLPGPTDSGAMDILIESKRIYLVCTQELASVHIAMRKADRLKRLGLEREARIVVNRFDPDHVMGTSTISDLVGLPVDATVPNSYTLASVSADKGSQVDPGTALGRSYAKLAGLVLNRTVEIPRKERRFLEFFSQPFQRRDARSA